MCSTRRTLLFLVFSALLTSAPASASQILFFAQQLPCSGVPLTCFPGGPGFPVLRQGPLYVPIDLPANSLIDEIDLWTGDGTQPVGIWDSSALPQPPSPPLIIPNHELVGFGSGDLQFTFSFFAVDGVNGAPYFEVHYRLLSPVLIAPAGRYWVGVSGRPMVGASDFIVFTPAFSSPANGTSSATPGVAIRVSGQAVPEPSTLLLMLSGGALVWKRARVR